MRLRSVTLLSTVFMAHLAGHCQAVATPAVSLVGQPVTISSLHSNGKNCSFYFDLTGQGLPGSNPGFYYQTGYGLTSYTFSGTYFPGTYTSTVDPGADSNCLLNYVEPVTFAVVQAGVSAAAALDGQYSFLCRGELLSGGRREGMDAAVGSFTADGAGHITAGLVDFNSTAGTLLNQSLTGTYTLDSTGAGEVTFKTPTTTMQYALRTAPLMAVSKVTGAALVADEAGYGPDSCTLALQTGPSNFTPTPVIYGAYLLQLSGETAQLPRVPLYGEQLLSLNGDNSSTSSGREFTAPSSGSQDATLSGTFSITDAVTGRTTLTLSTPGEPSTTPTKFVAYPVDAQRLFVMSIDSHAGADLITSKGLE